MSEASSLQPNETCSTLAVPDDTDRTLCREWRSCRSCLQKNGCMISASNKCVSVSDPVFGYNATIDYRKAFAANVTLPNATVSNPQGLQANQSWQFKAIETEYCAADDATCVQCTKDSFYRAGGAVDSRFCVGSDGCVCIYNCEYFVEGAAIADCSYHNRVVSDSSTSDSDDSSAPVPTPSVGTPSLSKESNGSQVDTPVLITSVAVLVIAVGIAIFVRHGRAKDRREEERRRAAVPRTDATRPQGSRAIEIEVQHLSLAGWNKHHDKLVASENRRLAGVDDVDTSAFTKLESPLNETTDEPQPRTEL